MSSSLWILAILALVPACGGRAVVEQGAGGSGGSGASTTTATSAPSTTTGVTTGPGPCSSHDDCPGGVCIFFRGECAAACEPGACDSCAPSTFCEPCATSSCPRCDDCRAACLPTQRGRCDDDDPCPPGFTCLWSQGVCAPTCSPDAPCDGFSFCDECASSSCCGCRNCDAACIGGE